MGGLLIRVFFTTGWAYDVSGYYPTSFFLGGCAAILASVLLIPVRNYRHASMPIQQHLNGTSQGDNISKELDPLTTKELQSQA